MRVTRHVKDLKPGEIFVFGSNEAGRHGRGAARTAKQWGARNGKGAGQWGNTYAIPTKDARLNCLTVRQIQKYVNDFIKYADQNPDYTFLVTEIGCGLAGNHPSAIAPLFMEASRLPNVHLPQKFWDHLNLQPA